MHCKIETGLFVRFRYLSVCMDVCLPLNVFGQSTLDLRDSLPCHTHRRWVTRTTALFPSISPSRIKKLNGYWVFVCICRSCRILLNNQLKALCIASLPPSHLLSLSFFFFISHSFCLPSHFFLSLTLSVFPPIFSFPSLPLLLPLELASENSFILPPSFLPPIPSA